MEFFQAPNNTINIEGANVSNPVGSEVTKKPVLFEKSATYFDNELVPKRAFTLLPRAKLVS